MMARHSVIFTPGDSTRAQKRALRLEAARAVLDAKPARPRVKIGRYRSRLSRGRSVPA